MEALLDPAAERRVKSPPRAGPPGLRLTPDDLEAYLDEPVPQGAGVRHAGDLPAERPRAVRRTCRRTRWSAPAR